MPTIGIRNLSPRSNNNPINLSATLRHSTSHLTSKHIPKTSKSLTLPAQILIAALDELDEFTSVDIGVAR
jgi:hypothetical protein